MSLRSDLLHRLLWLALVIASLPACSRWQPQGPTPAAVVRKLAPSEVRITRADGSKLTLRSPVLSGDSLVGRSPAGPRLAIPLDEVKAVATRRFDGLKTTGFVLGTAASAFLIYCAFADSCYLFHEDDS